MTDDTCEDCNGTDPECQVCAGTGAVMSDAADPPPAKPKRGTLATCSVCGKRIRFGMDIDAWRHVGQHNHHHRPTPGEAPQVVITKQRWLIDELREALRAAVSSWVSLHECEGCDGDPCSQCDAKALLRRLDGAS
jgi:hypothetical protein